MASIDGGLEPVARSSLYGSTWVNSLVLGMTYKCENVESSAAPCQCFSPAGMRITSLTVTLRVSVSVATIPVPEVTMRICKKIPPPLNYSKISYGVNGHSCSWWRLFPADGRIGRTCQGFQRWG